MFVLTVKALKKTVFLMVASLLIAFSASPAYAAGANHLVQSMDSIADVSLGNNIDLLREAFWNEPYTKMWSPIKAKLPDTALGYNHLYYHADGTVNFGDDVATLLHVYSGKDRIINKISYTMKFRTNGIHYTSNLKSVIKNATENFGTPEESKTKLGNRSADMKIWKSNGRTLTLFIYNEPYTEDFPYCFIIDRK